MTGSRRVAHPHDPFFRTGHQEGGEWWRAVLGCVRLDHFAPGTIAQFLHDEIGDLASS